MSLRNSQIFSWNGNVENRYIDNLTHNRNKMKKKYTTREFQKPPEHIIERDKIEKELRKRRKYMIYIRVLDIS